MARAWLCRLVLVAACKGPPEPVAEERPEPAPAPPPPPKMQTVRGEWYELQIPEGWVVLPTKNPAQVAAVEGAWSAPPGGNGATLILGRPAPSGNDLRAHADKQLGGLAQLGLTKTTERQSTLGGGPALLLDFSGAAATRLWLYQREGLTGSLNCGGRKASTELPLECEAIAASFRFAAPLPQAPQPVPATDGSKRAELEGFRMEIPKGWQSVRPPLPKIRWMLRTEAGHVISLTREAHAGDLALYDSLSNEEERSAGIRELKRRSARLLGVKALEVDLQFPLSYGGHRSVVLEAVKGGEAFALSCSAPADELEAARALCHRFAATLEVLPLTSH